MLDVYECPKYVFGTDLFVQRLFIARNFQKKFHNFFSKKAKSLSNSKEEHFSENKPSNEMRTILGIAVNPAIVKPMLTLTRCSP